VDFDMKEKLENLEAHVDEYDPEYLSVLFAPDYSLLIPTRKEVLA